MVCLIIKRKKQLSIKIIKSPSLEASQRANGDICPGGNSLHHGCGGGRQAESRHRFSHRAATPAILKESISYKDVFSRYRRTGKAKGASENPQRW